MGQKKENLCQDVLHFMSLLVEDLQTTDPFGTVQSPHPSLWLQNSRGKRGCVLQRQTLSLPSVAP